MWGDCAILDAAMDPVFEAFDQGEIISDQMATLFFKGGVEVPVESRPRVFAAGFKGLPLLSNRPSMEGGEYQNDLPRDLAEVVSRTQLAEVARHLVIEGQLNPEIFGDHNVLHETSGDTLGAVVRACESWQALNPDVNYPAFHLVTSDIKIWGDLRGIFSGGNLGPGIGQFSFHLCPEISDLFDGPESVSFLFAEPRDGRAAFDVIHFTDMDSNLCHTPTLAVRPIGDGRFDISLELRLRIDVTEPDWILAVVMR